ncbi:helix-turn-helix transcriptional regulator [Streptomyces sp. SDr-06]|uniref:helix-turn-helix transcriptional regulator n=1 Tax=Streptomyces sp. SDr-06 TaxID=2267702 RepID=UPI001CB91EBB|nr:LuxR family transcriptional regulator [Streptomyces sp. SDr-06]
MSAEPLAGRERERRVLRGVLRRFCDGRVQAVEITGDPGMGKTRLLAELERMAGALGRPVLRGAATTSRGGPGDLFGALTGGCSAEAVREALEAAAPPGTGLVVLLDNLHWADDACLAVLDDLLRRPPDTPVLFALAHRHRQSPPPLRSLVVNAYSGPVRMERLALGPLGRGAAAELLGGERADLSALTLQAGGNPLYLRLLAGARTGEHARAASEEVAARFEAQVGAELDRVSATARQVARAAAVVGESFTSELVARAAGLGELPALAAIDELVAEDLVRPVAAPRAFAFRHPLLRDVVYRGARPGWRVAAHTAVAEALTRRQADPAARARHVEHAARPGDREAVRVLAEAAHLMRLRQPESALRWLRTALRLLPADAPVQRARLQFRLARLLGAVGRLRESRALLHTVLEALPRVPAGIHADAVATCALVERSLGRRAESRSLLVHALQEPAAQDPAARGVLEFALAGDDLAEGRAGDCAARAERALQEAERRGDHALAAAAHGLLSLTGVHTGAIGPAQAHCASAAALVDGLLDGQLAERLDTVVWLGWSETMLGRPWAALRHLNRALSVARGSGREVALAHLLVAQSFAARSSGRLEEAAAAAAEAVETAVRCGAQEALGGALAMVCRTAVATGDVDGALRAGTQARQDGAAGGGWFGAVAARALAEARLAAGDAGACRAALEEAGGPRLAGVDAWSKVDWYELLCRAALAEGRLDAARRWAGRAVAAARPLGLPGRTGLAELALAQVRAAERPESGYANAAAAYDGLAAVGQVIDAGRARLAAAGALAARGERRRAVTELAAAQRTFATCGARTLARSASTERRRIAARPPQDAGRPGVLAPLTRREGEVAALVSEGLTNRQIAQRLQVTEKTVQMHLSNAFTKLGVPSRAALASAVVRAALA